MSDIDISQRAIGLVSIGNPITLIASLERYKHMASGYKVYVYLNVPREHTSPERLQTLTTNAYKILDYYKQFFRDLVIIENTSNMWVTHGQCIDMLVEIIQEEKMAIFEEDAFVYSDGFFGQQFDLLDSKDLVCVVAPQNPNNFQQLFSKLSIFTGAVNMPGKESVFFVRKDIVKKYNWFGFDYVKWIPETVYIRPEGTQLTFKEEIYFDTFEFFSLNCWMNPDIKTITYNEENYDYWIPEGRNDIDGFFRSFFGGKHYIHYFNGALFQYLDYLHPKNKSYYANMVNSAGHFGQFMYHMSTYTIHLAMQNAVKERYVALLGNDEYQLQRQSLKNAIRYLFKYFGTWKIRQQYKFVRFIRFTFKFMKKWHGIVH